MLIGLVSDSHDNTPLARHVGAFFRERRVDRVFHLGDVTQPESLEPFEGMPLVVVRGNNDDETSWPATWQQELAGVRVGATHGHMRGQLARLVEECDVVLHGHTHRRVAHRVDGKLVVNPGALHRATTKTCALLELPAKRVVFYRVDESGVARL
ncbi:MAG TPA: metallophosphoesterase [Candidatus Thermoplasmatota archaeon]|nr:metallophosphoesterase [Candidatus Thermoplasmatota archaeon]